LFIKALILIILLISFAAFIKVRAIAERIVLTAITYN